MDWWKKGSKGRGELSSSGSFAALRMTAEAFFLIDDSRSFSLIDDNRSFSLIDDSRSFLPDR
jgi:hypothetical protein